MKILLTVVISLVSFVAGAFADPIRILRIGDSITWQQSGDATLQDLLDAAGVAYQFVGTQNWFDDGGYVPLTIAREENQYNEGYPGMTVQWFNDPSFSWASWQARPTHILRGNGNTPIRHALTHGAPDIILLMIGTNNTQRDKNNVRGEESSGEVDVGFLSGEFNDLLESIDAFAPQAQVIVAELINVIDTGTGNGAHRSVRTLHFNEQVVRPLVLARITAGKPYSLVNFFPLLDVPDDFMDSVHPNTIGIPKLNTAWFEAIMALSAADPYTDWLNANGISGGPQDLTGGVANLLRYALGGSASTPAQALLPQLQAQAGSAEAGLSLTFYRIDDARLRYAVWFSDDLADWGEAPLWQHYGADNGVAGPFTLELDFSAQGGFLMLEVVRD